jgi:hypothetical protein
MADYDDVILLPLLLSLVLVLFVSFIYTARRCSRLWLERRSKAARADENDSLLPDNNLDERSSMKRLHQNAYREMQKEVMDLRQMQTEVRSQLGALKQAVAKMKENRLPSVEPISKED